MIKNTKNPTRPVYSTDHGRMCPDCSQPIAACICRRQDIVSRDGIVRVGLESKGRGGKQVTTVVGVPVTVEKLLELGQELRKMCGSGGTVKNGRIEIQGNHRQGVIEELRKRGWVVKSSGG